MGISTKFTAATLSVFLASLFIPVKAYAGPAMHWGSFTITNSVASGFGNPAFCTFVAQDAMQRNGLTPHVSGNDVWGATNDATAVIFCQASDNNTAYVIDVVSSDNYDKAANLRNALRTSMVNFCCWL